MASIQGKVVQVRRSGSCQVVTSNAIAVAITPPERYPILARRPIPFYRAA